MVGFVIDLFYGFDMEEILNITPGKS
jgi:hypothetical protein